MIPGTYRIELIKVHNNYHPPVSFALSLPVFMALSQPYLLQESPKLPKQLELIIVVFNFFTRGNPTMKA